MDSKIRHKGIRRKVHNAKVEGHAARVRTTNFQPHGVWEGGGKDGGNQGEEGTSNIAPHTTTLPTRAGAAHKGITRNMRRGTATLPCLSDANHIKIMLAKESSQVTTFGSRQPMSIKGGNTQAGCVGGKGLSTCTRSVPAAAAARRSATRVGGGGTGNCTGRRRGGGWGRRGRGRGHSHRGRSSYMGKSGGAT